VFDAGKVNRHLLLSIQEAKQEDIHKTQRIRLMRAVKASQKATEKQNQPQQKGSSFLSK
jgi:hypothetical protein